MVTEMRWYCGIRHATYDTRLQGDRRASITRIKLKDTDAATDQCVPADADKQKAPLFPHWSNCAKQQVVIEESRSRNTKSFCEFPQDRPL
jgi:hypothetical protein